MKVKFKRAFFAPNNCRYRKNEWHDVPDEWEERLPKDAAIDDAPPVEAISKKKKSKQGELSL